MFILHMPDIQEPTGVCNPSEVSKMQRPYMMMCFCKADFADFADSRVAVLAALGYPCA